MNLETNVNRQKITETLSENYMPYAMSVIVSRAIPEIDGFKPSHRKILYTMYKMNLLKGARTKSANVVGQTMKLHPHGDLAIYETMVRLTRGHDALLHPYIDSKGNFGKVSSRDMAYAAPRYTEVKLAPISECLFTDIKSDTVDFVDNYDGRMQEPVLLPVRFPNILVNPNKGIAVGMASSFPSFNLGEVCDFTIARMQDASADPMDYIPAPDFSTGGYLIHDERTMRSIYETGLGSFKLRAKFEFDKKNSCLEIKQIPYTTTVEAIMDKIISIYKEGRLKEIVDIRDETDLQGLKIAIDLKKGTDVEMFMARLYKLTPLEDSFSCNFNLLIKGKPVVLGLAEIVDEWIQHRLGEIVRRLRFELGKLEERLHLLHGLEKVILDIDKAIEIIRNTADDSKVVPNLMEGFAIDEVQANYVAEIKLRNLNKNYIIKALSDIEDLKKEIDAIKANLASDEKLKGIIAGELEDVKKDYAKPRLTELIKESKHIEIKEEVLIDDYRLKFFLSKEGYLKKISLQSLRSSGEQKFKENDELLSEMEASNASDLMLFSDRANVYFVKAHELEDSKASELGSYLNNLIDLEPGEKIIFMHASKDYKGYFLFAFEDGKLAKVPLSAYETKTNRKKLLKAYGVKAKLFRALFIDDDIDILYSRSDAKGKNLMLFHSSLVNQKTTRNTQGVQVIRVKKNSWISSIRPAREVELEDLEYYRTESIPSAGTPIRPDDYFNAPEL